MDRKLECLRCGNPMEYAKSEKIQLGESGWMLRGLPNLMSDSLAVEIYLCKECGKIEFYHTNEELIAKIQCPGCGKLHDKSYRKCPFCKYDYKAK